MEVERRSLLKGLAAGLTGTVATPSPTDAHTSQPTTDTARPPAGTFLDDHQRRTLRSLADMILPGSVAAGVVERIDRTAAVDTATSQRRLVSALAAFDQQARDAGSSRWMDLSDDAQRAILTRASTEATGLPARDRLDALKATIGAAYASTEAGMRALGWTGRASWRELPGCTHPEGAHE